jgi:hypothetical protein
MTKDFSGAPVVIDRQFASDDLWFCEPFSRGQAWLDLWLLANDDFRTIVVRGVTVNLKPGQVGWSVIKLSERWQWSREKTRAFVEQLRDLRKISYKMNNVATVITLLDYSVLNKKTTPIPTAESTAETIAVSTAEPTQNRGTGEQGNGNRGTGEGGSPPDSKSSVPSEEEVLAFAQTWPGDMSRGIPPGIPEAWVLGWFANVVQSDRPVCNWRRILVLRFTADWVAGHSKARGESLGKKNGAAGEKMGALEDRLSELASLALELKGKPGAEPILTELRTVRHQLNVLRGLE